MLGRWPTTTNRLLSSGLLLWFVASTATTRTSAFVPSSRLSSSISSMTRAVPRLQAGAAASEADSDTTSSSSPPTAAAAAAVVTNFPKLIVLDLDNTVWTPELYQLRQLRRSGGRPVAGRDVTMFDGARALLARLRDGDLFPPSTRLAVASRTSSVEWARDLLEQFRDEFGDALSFVEIFPGDKRQHFERLRRDSGVAYEDMLFFDDNRDGRYGNCVPVSALGVLSVHCPHGLYASAVWETALQRFDAWDKAQHTIVEADGTVSRGNGGDGDGTTAQNNGNSNGHATNGEQQKGKVKVVNVEKRFGFISRGGGGGRRGAKNNNKSNDVFFHFNDLPDGVTAVEQGDTLTFTVVKDPRNGKFRASNVQVVGGSGSNSDASDTNTISLRAFSMNMPFAALLANGHKTLESRNGTMFAPYEEGTHMLLHVGRRTYPDGNRHLDIMREQGLDEDAIRRLKSLPSDGEFGTGMLVAIMELGRTYDTTVAERSTPEVQRSICAYGTDSGRRLTEIRKVAWLTRPVPMAAQGGVFKVRIDPAVVPGGWDLPEGTTVLPDNSSRVQESGTKDDDGKDGKAKLVYSISG